MSFVKEDDTWEYAPDTTIALTESSMQNMEDAFLDIQAVKEIKNPDDLSDYGFDSPEYNLTLTGKDGEAHKFLIGNASGENYYFMEDGTEKVYTVSADLISEMVWQLADVAEKDSFVTVTSDNFVKETVTKPGDEVKTYEADNEDQEDTVTSIMTALSGFYFTDCADYHVTDATLGNYRGFGRSADEGGDDITRIRRMMTRKRQLHSMWEARTTVRPTIMYRWTVHKE